MDCDALFAAVAGGDVEALRQMLNDASADLDLERVNEEYRTVLHLAVLRGDLDSTNLLLLHGADVGARSADDDTCLHLAAKTGREDLVKLLLGSINVNTSNRLGRTSLHVATMRNKYGAARLLLNEGADPNTRDLTTSSPLHDAVRYIRRPGGRSLVELLLRRGADPNARDSAGNSPFHASFDVLDEQLLELFLDKRADPNLRDEAGRNALHLAASRSRLEIVERLLELGMDVDDADTSGRSRPLHLAILGGHSEDATLGVVRLLVERGAQVDAVDADDRTPLYHAAASDRPRIAEYLLSRGAEVDGRSGKRPLFAAAKHGHLRLIELLINQGARVDAKSYAGETALHVAVKGIRGDERLRRRTVRTLLENGANANEADFVNGVSVSQLALERGDPGLFKLLLEYGASLGARNSLNQSLLHVACQHNLGDTVRELMAVLGGEVNRTFSSGESPISLCVLNDNEEIFMTLLRNGASVSGDRIAVSDAAYKGRVDMMRLLLAYGARIDRATAPVEPTSTMWPTVVYAIRGCQPRMLELLLDVEFDADRRTADASLLRCAAEVHRANESESSADSVKALILQAALLASLQDGSTPSELMGFDAEYAACRAELEIAKGKRICDDFEPTYYDFLARSNNALVRCLRNERVNDALRSGAYAALFPNYCGRLRVHYANGMTRLRMMDEFRAVLEGVFKNVLPDDVLLEISEYFNFTDFVNCFDQLAIFNIVKS